MTDNRTPPITEPTPAPEVYVDGFTCAVLMNSVVKLPMFSVTQTDRDDDVTQRIVLRLAVPLPAILGMHEALGRLIEQLKAQGVISPSETN